MSNEKDTPIAASAVGPGSLRVAESLEEDFPDKLLGERSCRPTVKRLIKMDSDESLNESSDEDEEHAAYVGRIRVLESLIGPATYSNLADVELTPFKVEEGIESLLTKSLRPYLPGDVLPAIHSRKDDDSYYLDSFALEVEKAQKAELIAILEVARTAPPEKLELFNPIILMGIAVLKHTRAIRRCLRHGVKVARALLRESEDVALDEGNKLTLEKAGIQIKPPQDAGRGRRSRPRVPRPTFMGAFRTRPTQEFFPRSKRPFSERPRSAGRPRKPPSGGQ